jgi:MFS transporter, YNFM family, putative membrane transport protein
MSIDRRRVAISLAAFCAFLDLYAPQAVLPLLREELDVGAGDVGLLVSATTFAIALIAPFTGAVADVLGRKRVIATAMMVLVLPTILVALATSLPMLVLWRFVQGLLLPPVFTVTIAYIAEEFPPGEATAVTGLYISASSLGGFLGRFLTGILAEQLGWRDAFLVLAAVTLACAIGVAVLLPPERGFTRAAGVLSSARQMLRHLTDRRLVAIYAVGFGVLFTFVATFTYVNFHLAAAPYQLSPSALGAIFAVYLMGSLVSPLTGRGVARFGRRRLVVGLIALWAAGLALTLVPSLGAIIAGLALGVACGFVCQAVATGFVALNAPTGRSSAIGLYATCYYLGGSAGGVLPALAWNAAGWPGCVALLLAVLMLLAFLVELSWRDVAKPIGDASAR